MSKRLSEQVIAELRAGVARAKSKPTGFDMGTWAENFETALYRVEDEYSVGLDRVAPPCGTAGCLAFEVEAARMEAEGVAVTLDAVEQRLFRLRYGAVVSKFAAEWNLPEANVRMLFHVWRWPDDLGVAYVNSPPLSAKRVAVLEQAVERWIAGDGSFE